MAKFVSKYFNYSILLKSGVTKFIENEKVVTAPVKATFSNGLLDTQSEDIKRKLNRLDWTEEKLLKFLRKRKSFRKDFWEMDKEPIKVKDLIDTGIRDLDEVLEEVTDVGVLQNAIEVEKAKDAPRKMAIGKFKKKLKDILGDLDD